MSGFMPHLIHLGSSRFCFDIFAPKKLQVTSFPFFNGRSPVLASCFFLSGTNVLSAYECVSNGLSGGNSRCSRPGVMFVVSQLVTLIMCCLTPLCENIIYPPDLVLFSTFLTSIVKYFGYLEISSIVFLRLRDLGGGLEIYVSMNATDRFYPLRFGFFSHRFWLDIDFRVFLVARPWHVVRRLWEATTSASGTMVNCWRLGRQSSLDAWLEAQVQPGRFMVAKVLTRI